VPRTREQARRDQLLLSLEEAGVSQAPPRWRGRALLRLLALAVVCAGSFYIGSRTLAQFSDAAKLLMVILFFLVAGAIASPVIIAGLRAIGQLSTPSAHRALRYDLRLPILYLRSFGLEEMMNSRLTSMERLFGFLSFIFISRTFEDQAVLVLRKLGPVIAIGRPGEKIAPIGASRFYVDDEIWQRKIAEIVSASQLVLSASGTTEGLRWELSHLLSALAPEKLILWAHPNIIGLTGQAREREWQVLLKQFGNLFPHPLPGRLGEIKFFHFSRGFAPNPVLSNEYALRRPHADALRALLKSTGRLDERWWYWRSKRTSARATLGFVAGMCAWLLAAVLVQLIVAFLSVFTTTRWVRRFWIERFRFLLRSCWAPIVPRSCRSYSRS
jgi:hypothetical protein